MKSLLYSLLIGSVLIFGCSKDFVEPEDEIIGAPENLKSGGDNIYDILGYGYDITGRYMDSYSAKEPVIDMNKVKALYNDRIIENNSAIWTSIVMCGQHSEAYSRALSLTVNAGCSYKLFRGQISNEYNTTISTTSEYSYASCNYLLIRRKVNLNISNSMLLNALSDQFIADLNDRSPEYIIQHYGTHVLKEVILGQKLQISYQSKTTATDKKEAVQAGLGFNCAMFVMNAKVNYNSYLVTSNYEQRIKYQGFGGDPSCAPSGITFGVYPFTTINITSWLNSCNNSNMVFIDASQGTMIDIYDLVADFDKRNALKTAIENYINNPNSINI